METKEIKFGTDGWRAVIGDGFTFQNVRRVTQATCDAIRKTSTSRLIMIGFDRRFFSNQFAETAARVALGNGFRVEMSQVPIGSPTLSFHVKSRKAAVGIMITASHNPYYFNGFKLKGAHGGSVPSELTKNVEDRLDTNDIQSESKDYKKFDFTRDYLAQLKKHFRFPNLKNLKGPLVFDAMHGASAQAASVVFNSPRMIPLRFEPDPLFGGVNPEPIETNLELLKKTVLEKKAALGIALDGDADRIGVIDDTGRYLPPHTVMPLLLLHLIEGRKLKGKVVQTVSMGYLNSRVAKKYNLPFEEVAVGFKHIAKRMGEEKVLFGGEESGGYGVGLWGQERDGLLCALLLVEMLEMRKKPLSVLVRELQAEFGVSFFERVDFTMGSDFDKELWLQRISGTIGTTLAGLAVTTVNTTDGLKILLQDDSWLLLRPSGTEPLIRTYAEATTLVKVKEMLEQAKKWALTPISSAKTKKKSDASKKTNSRRK